MRAAQSVRCGANERGEQPDGQTDRGRRSESVRRLIRHLGHRRGDLDGQVPQHL